MNELQQQLLSMYREISRILDSAGIEYFLYYGSAIGTLRHGGFIPWDDDLDLAVWSRDLPRINELLRSGLDPDRYYYHIPRADNHPHVVLRTENFEDRLKNKTAPFIDIFVIEKYPEGRFRRIIAKTCIWSSLIGIEVIDHIRNYALYRLLSPIPRWFERRARGCPEENSGTVTLFTTCIKKEIFPEEYFKGSVSHKFEDIEVPLPSGVEKILSSYYGDYMTPPPEDKRQGATGYPCSIWNDYRYEKSGLSKGRT